jgi:hypothetical protein
VEHGEHYPGPASPQAAGQSSAELGEALMTYEVQPLTALERAIARYERSFRSVIRDKQAADWAVENMREVLTADFGTLDELTRQPNDQGRKTDEIPHRS